jgi:hypothetical protein
MTDFRDVPMSAEQARIIDEILVPTLMRGDETEMASHMMALALAWRFAPVEKRDLPQNVVPFESRRVGA